MKRTYDSARVVAWLLSGIILPNKSIWETIWYVVITTENKIPKLMLQTLVVEWLKRIQKNDTRWLNHFISTTDTRWLSLFYFKDQTCHIICKRYDMSYLLCKLSKLIIANSSEQKGCDTVWFLVHFTKPKLACVIVNCLSIVGIGISVVSILCHL